MGQNKNNTPCAHIIIILSLNRNHYFFQSEIVCAPIFSHVFGRFPLLGKGTFLHSSDILFIVFFFTLCSLHNLYKCMYVSLFYLPFLANIHTHTHILASTLINYNKMGIILLHVLSHYLIIHDVTDTPSQTL